MSFNCFKDLPGLGFKFFLIPNLVIYIKVSKNCDEQFQKIEKKILRSQSLGSQTFHTSWFSKVVLKQRVLFKWSVGKTFPPRSLNTWITFSFDAFPLGSYHGLLKRQGPQHWWCTHGIIPRIHGHYFNGPLECNHGNVWLQEYVDRVEHQFDSSYSKN